MIEIQINKDIGSFQPKIAGPFTGRQLCCVTAGGAAAMLIYYLTAPFLTPSTSLFLAFIPAAAAVLFGWVTPLGLPMERFLKSAFVGVFLAPTTRKYISNGSPEEKKEKCKYKPSRAAVR